MSPSFSLVLHKATGLLKYEGWIRAGNIIFKERRKLSVAILNLAEAPNGLAVVQTVHVCVFTVQMKVFDRPHKCFLWTSTHEEAVYFSPNVKCAKLSETSESTWSAASPVFFYWHLVLNLKWQHWRALPNHKESESPRLSIKCLEKRYFLCDLQKISSPHCDKRL